MRVCVVFGLRVQSGVVPLLGEAEDPLWEFDDEFEAALPSTQRSMLRLCRELGEELLILLLVNKTLLLQKIKRIVNSSSHTNSWIGKLSNLKIAIVPRPL